jgi:hypothetical protein
MRALLLLGCLIAASLPAQAQTYKCVDARGKVSYSDKARPGCEAVRLGGAKAPAAKAAPGAPSVQAAPGAAKGAPPRKGPLGARTRAEAAPPAPALTEAQFALRCRGLRQERAWLASERGAGVAGRDERLGQIEQALRGCP